MKRTNNLWTQGAMLAVVGLCLALATPAHAADSDLSTTTSAPSEVSAGQPFTVTVGYANAGPDAAGSPYVNSYFVPPMGLDVVFDNDLNGDGSLYTAIQSTAEGTDTLGNAPLLFYDSNFCEEMNFQVQRSDGDEDANPLEGLDAGVSATFSYQLIPMASGASSTVTITEPANLAQSWHGNITSILDAASKNAFSRGGCEPLVGDFECEFIADNCFGARVSRLDAPIEAEFELVDDGSADPLQGCNTLVDFTPGNIAVLRRGGCQFGDKGFNAEDAGAVAVFMVNADSEPGNPDPNTGTCSTFPDSDQCVINMAEGVLGGLVTIPIIQVAIADGEPVIAALEGGATVRGIFGDPSVFTAQSTVFLADVGDSDPDETNDDSFARAMVSAIPDAPVAAFTYAPAAPITGSPVQFTDASTGGAPTTWAWSFGDGGTSTEQNPAHTFTSAGTFPVTLTAANAGGSSTASMDVTVTLGAALTEAYFIPAAALAAGLEGAFFQTDVDLNNGGAADALYAFLWLPRGQNNSTPTQSETFPLTAGASIRYSNVLAEVFNAEPDVAGALAVLSNSGDLNIMSRTYNLPTAKAAGTFGQALPGVPAGDLIQQNETKRIIFMSENADLRANLGCVNGVNDSVRIKLDLYGDGGALLESRNMDLGPWSNNQFNQIFAAYAPTNGYVDVSAAKAGAAFYCYGSVLDNGSNDPTSILPTEYGSATTYFVPAAALAAGQEGSFFQTDVDINNAGSTMATYQFLWLPRGVDNSSPTTSGSFTLLAGASARYENVLEEVFDAAPDVAGALAITSDTASLGIMSRTYNLPTAKVAGTFGQDIPGIPADQLIMQGETKRIIFMSENDDFRANFGCVNGVNDSVRINISMYDDSGALLGTRNMDLPAWSNNQFNQILNEFSPTDGYIDFVANKAGAAIYCYGSVLDNGSSDPTTILPQ